MASMSSSVSLVTTAMPLTTIFTPPARCTSLPFTFFDENDGTSTFWRDVDGPGDGTMSACYPSSYGYQHNPTVTAEYSPGVCPSGYVGAGVDPNGVEGPATSYCCPSGFTYQPQFACETLVTTPTVVAINPTENISISTPFLAADWYIKVVWASSDLDAFSPKSAPVLTTTTSSVDTTATTVPTSTATSASSGTGAGAATSTPSASDFASHGLSKGAQAGIGVGVALGIIAIAAGGAFLCSRHRKKHAYGTVPVAEKSATDNASAPRVQYAQYAHDPQMIHEIDGEIGPAEADSTPARHELPGSGGEHEISAAPKSAV